MSVFGELGQARLALVPASFALIVLSM